MSTHKLALVTTGVWSPLAETLSALLHHIKLSSARAAGGAIIVQHRQQQSCATGRQRSCRRLCSPACALRGGRCRIRQKHRLSIRVACLNPAAELLSAMAAKAMSLVACNQVSAQQHASAACLGIRLCVLQPMIT